MMSIHEVPPSKEFIIHIWSYEDQKRALPHKTGSMQKDFGGQREQSGWANLMLNGMSLCAPYSQAALPLLQRPGVQVL